MRSNPPLCRPIVDRRQITQALIASVNSHGISRILPVPTATSSCAVHAATSPGRCAGDETRAAAMNPPRGQPARELQAIAAVPELSFRPTPDTPRARISRSRKTSLNAASALPIPSGRMLEMQLRSASVLSGRGRQVR